MTAAFEHSDGTVSAPGITFGDETGSGLYRAGANDIRFAINGTDVFKITATGITMLSTLVLPLVAWTEPTLAKGTTTNAKYMKDASGFVSMKGKIVAGTGEGGDTFFTLPAGCRPAVKSVFPLLVYTTLDAPVPLTNHPEARIEVNTDGTFVVTGTDAGELQASNYFHIDVVRFSTT